MSDQSRAPRNATNDDERAEAILQSLSRETLQIYDMLRDGLVEEASMKTFEVNIVRDMVKDTITQVRGEAYGTAAGTARVFARNCTAAAAQFSGPHHRTMIKMVADLFEQYAQTMESRSGMMQLPLDAPSQAVAAAPLSEPTARPAPTPRPVNPPIDLPREARPAIDEVGEGYGDAAGSGDGVVNFGGPRGFDRRN